MAKSCAPYEVLTRTIGPSSSNCDFWHLGWLRIFLRTAGHNHSADSVMSLSPSLLVSVFVGRAGKISTGSDRLFIHGLSLQVAITAESKSTSEWNFIITSAERNESNQHTLRMRFYHLILDPCAECVFVHRLGLVAQIMRMIPVGESRWVHMDGVEQNKVCSDERVRMPDARAD